MADSIPFNMYLEDVVLMGKFFHELDNVRTTWECFKDKPDKQIYTKSEEGLNLISILYRFKIDTNLFDPFSLLVETDMLKEWVPTMKKSDPIKEFSPFRKALHMHKEMPFPISDRELVLCSTAAIVKERKGAMIMIRSANSER